MENLPLQTGSIAVIIRHVCGVFLVSSQVIHCGNSVFSENLTYWHHAIIRTDQFVQIALANNCVSKTELFAERHSESQPRVTIDGSS